MAPRQEAQGGWKPADTSVELARARLQTLRSTLAMETCEFAAGGRDLRTVSALESRRKSSSLGSPAPGP
jgi:hypothetical protein